MSRTQVIADEELAAPLETRKMKARETSSFICQQEIVNGLRTKKRLSEVVSKTKNLDILTDVYRLLEKVKVVKMITKNTNFNL